MLKQPGRGKKHVCQRAVEAGAQPLLDIRESTQDPHRSGLWQGGESAMLCGLQGNPKIRRAGGALTHREVLLELLHGVCTGQTQLRAGKEKQNVYLIYRGGELKPTDAVRRNDQGRRSGMWEGEGWCTSWML